MVVGCSNRNPFPSTSEYQLLAVNRRGTGVQEVHDPTGRTGAGGDCVHDVVERNVDHLLDDQCRELDHNHCYITYLEYSINLHHIDTNHTHDLSDR